MKKTPVHIITGFLGSGKTTFLNHFIKEQLPERILVIENECGATNVDGGLVMDGVEEVIELSAGCLCCTLADGLIEVLEEAANRRDQYDRLVIETTGIADPSSILQVFLQDPRVEKVFDLQQVICLVDAGLVEDWLEETEEALRQISLADVLLINKIDTVAPTYQKEVQKLLRNINPNAKVMSGEQGVFALADILNTGTINQVSVETIADGNHHDHEHGDGDNNNHKITTFTLTFPGPLDLNHLQLDLNRIVMLFRHQVYRVKGFIAIPNYPNKVILQSARNTFIATDGPPWESENERIGKLVFIGRGLKKKPFEKMFNRHLVS
ncbi:GTP-binding protein [Fulvivirga sp. RKSG066]|uniref:CobW family GTP-binding protein n=1 Tax=Fulvivirga aurantia TaxID=2529383 RepID=UPI0012BC1AF7|nr:GTP-binding protein [Fulvivirga aurantia]MTI21730.1 GTP-binding protein [Fulvivirga aurantia]